LKIISVVENGLSQLHNQRFDLKQKQLIAEFIENPNSYKEKAVKTSSITHQDGSTERWRVELSHHFFVFVDCSIPGPWSTSDDNAFYGVVIIVGFDAGNGNFFLS